MMWWATNRDSDEFALLKDELKNRMKAATSTPFKILFHLFENPSWLLQMGKKGYPLLVAAEIIQWTIIVMIIVSTGAFVFETVPQLSSDPDKNPDHYEFYDGLCKAIEIFSVAMFTCDIVARFIGAMGAGKEDLNRFMGDKMNMVDFMAVAPVCVRLIDPTFFDMRFMRVIRLSRVLSTMRNSRYANLGSPIWSVIVRSGPALTIPLHFMSIMSIVVSAVTYMCEGTAEFVCEMDDGTVIEDWSLTPDSPGNAGCMEGACPCAGTLLYRTHDGKIHSSESFTDIPRIMWWCFVTFTVSTTRQVSPSPSQPVLSVLDMTVRRLGADGRLRRHDAKNKRWPVRGCVRNVHGRFPPRHAAGHCRQCLRDGPRGRHDCEEVRGASENATNREEKTAVSGRNWSTTAGCSGQTAEESAGEDT